MPSRTGNLVSAAVFAALIALTTLFLRVPLPMGNGYCNLGDALVLLSGVLSPGGAAAACAMGSALADLIGGYAVYAPASALIKGGMGLMAAYWTAPGKPLSKRLPALLLPECVMILGYFIFECLLFGSGAAALGLPGNGCQAVIGIVLAALLQEPLNKAVREIRK